MYIRPISVNIHTLQVCNKQRRPYVTFFRLTQCAFVCVRTFPSRLRYADMLQVSSFYIMQVKRTSSWNRACEELKRYQKQLDKLRQETDNFTKPFVDSSSDDSDNEETSSELKKDDKNKANSNDSLYRCQDVDNEDDDDDDEEDDDDNNKGDHNNYHELEPEPPRKKRDNHSSTKIIDLESTRISSVSVLPH